MPPSEASVTLPEGWTKHESKSRPGTYYYYAQSTGERTWDLPTEPAAGGKRKRSRRVADPGAGARTPPPPPQAATYGGAATDGGAARAARDEPGNADSTARRWILRPEELERSPSRRDGIASALEKQYRRETCEFAHNCATRLELFSTRHRDGRLVLATAQVFFHRFFAVKSFQDHDRFLVAQACVFLASKVEEHPQRLQEILLAFHEERHGLKRGAGTLDPTSAEYAQLKESVLKAEFCLLSIVSFDLTVEHPYEAINGLIEKMHRSGHISESDHCTFLEAAISFLTDSFRTSLCLQHEPKTIASGIIFLSTVYLRKLPPEGPMVKAYWNLLSISERSIRSICEQVMELYNTNAAFAEMRAKLQQMGHLPHAAA